MMDLVRFASAFVRIAQEKGPEKPPYWGAWQALSAARGKPFSGFLRLLLEAEETWPEFGRWSELAGGGAAREYWEAAQKTGTYRATTQTGEDQVLIVLFEDTLWGTMEVGHMELLPVEEDDKEEYDDSGQLDDDLRNVGLGRALYEASIKALREVGAASMVSGSKAGTSTTVSARRVWKALCRDHDCGPDQDELFI